ncbi:hypothetical protein CVT25_000605 [Psilocybe cyanescens]|uniref:Uncharacterized protein n=1 Tax=Psilocybe cyanescens TaxID=93625 RepID=A0A409XU82_PSICY|nr:hypothetical protein CVT25_000605 [Psilocybe cyanescens]
MGGVWWVFIGRGAKTTRRRERERDLETPDIEDTGMLMDRVDRGTGWGRSKKRRILLSENMSWGWALRNGR